MALGPVTRCDELTDDVNAVTQLDNDIHRLHPIKNLQLKSDARHIRKG